MNDSFLLRLQTNQLDLGYMAGDVLQAQPAATAEPGAHVITVNTEDVAQVERYDGTGHVIGRVTDMFRKVPGADA